MMQRSRPPGHGASRVIALWKDPTTGVREIPLEPGAQAVLLTLCMDRATRYSADRRWPVENSTSTYQTAVHQVRASTAGSTPPPSRSTPSTKPALSTEDLTILTVWAEGVSEAAAYAPQRVVALLAEARSAETWRAELGLSEPSPRLSAALQSLTRLVGRATAPAGTPLFDAILAEAGEEHPSEETLDRLVRRVLLSMLEERATRTPPTSG
jgi:hypothetical protein